MSDSKREYSCEDLHRLFPSVSFGEAVQILGLKNVRIGEGSCVGDGSWLNVCTRDDQVRMTIGKCVLIGRHSMISTGGRLSIGDYCLFAPRVYVSDADHTYADISRPIMEQVPTLNRELVVEENCWFGINTVVSGSINVGRGSVVAANSVVLQDVPPFSVVAGSPARIIKMYNSQNNKWEKATSYGECQRIMALREIHPIPARDQYREVLLKNAEMKSIVPVLSGRGQCI